MDYTTYINSPLWESKKQAYIDSDYPLLCFHCKSTTRYLQFHHRSYIPIKVEKLTDIIPLCFDCHSELTNIYQSIKNYKDIDIWNETNKWIHKDLMVMFEKRFGTEYYTFQQKRYYKRSAQELYKKMNAASGKSQSYVPSYYSTPANWAAKTHISIAAHTK